MKRGEIYRKAALEMEQIIGAHYYSCWTIDDVSDSDGSARDAKTFYAKFYKPHRARMDDGWFSDIPLDDINGYRVLALCFMAAIAEDEEQ